MNLADNIKDIREEKNLKQIELATDIGVDKSAYSKIEKVRALTVDELQKMAQLFNTNTDEEIDYDGKVPKEAIIEDKTAVEQIASYSSLTRTTSKPSSKSLTRCSVTRSLRTSFRTMWLLCNYIDIRRNGLN